MSSVSSKNVSSLLHIMLGSTGREPGLNELTQELLELSSVGNRLKETCKDCYQEYFQFKTS